MREAVTISYNPIQLFHFNRTEEAVIADVALEIMDQIYQHSDELMNDTVLYALSQPGLRPNHENELIPYIKVDLSNVFFDHWDEQGERAVYLITFDFNMEGYKRSKK